LGEETDLDRTAGSTDVPMKRALVTGIVGTGKSSALDR
jgi:hypothetical protein